MIRNEFVLLGNKADTRNKIGIEDKRLYTLDMDDLQNNPFTIGHRQRGLVSLGHYQAGSEFGEYFQRKSYFIKIIKTFYNFRDLFKF